MKISELEQLANEHGFTLVQNDIGKGVFTYGDRVVVRADFHFGETQPCYFVCDSKFNDGFFCTDFENLMDLLKVYTKDVTEFKRLKLVPAEQSEQYSTDIDNAIAQLPEKQFGRVCDLYQFLKELLANSDKPVEQLKKDLTLQGYADFYRLIILPATRFGLVKPVKRSRKVSYRITQLGELVLKFLRQYLEE